jgi:hypothetical protein
MSLYSFIYDIRFDMFRPVIAAIIGYCHDYAKGRTEVEASLLQLKYKLIIMFVY